MEGEAGRAPRRPVNRRRGSRSSSFGGREGGDVLTIDDDESDPYFYEPDDHTPCALAPPEAFSDEPAPRKWVDLLWPDQDPERTGPNSAAVESRLFSSCAGWREPPTARELYEAIREPQPTRRQRNIVNMWAAEATPREIFKAWAEHAYTWLGLSEEVERRYRRKLNAGFGGS